MTRRGGSRCELTFLEEGQDINLTQRYRYMYTTLDERARALEKGLVWLEKEMVERADLEGMALTPVGVPRQEPVLVCGRVRLLQRGTGTVKHVWTTQSCADRGLVRVWCRCAVRRRRAG